MMRRRVVGLLIAMGALIFAFDSSAADASAAARHRAHHTAHKHHAAHKRTHAKKSAAKHAPARSLAIVTRPPQDAPDFDYQDRIEKAQDLVAKQPVLPGDMVVDARGNLTHFTWTLAVGGKTGPLTILRMDETGKNDQGFTVTWPVNNFINTKFQVARPDGYIVFAQRRPVRNAKHAWEEAVYTAYAPELDTPKMREAGLDYLRHLQNQAYNRIQSHDVRSKVEPDATVADKIPRGMVLRLMITEHIDPLHMKHVGIEQCVHEVLVTLAANKGRSYAYARSSAGAMGLAQFVEDSYDMVREHYPKALLEPDFRRGMTNLGNAVLASVLLMDLELTHLPDATLKVVSQSAHRLAAFLAAGYNRNPAHVVRTYHRTRSFTGGKAPFENKMYVRMQSWVGEFLKKEYGIPDARDS
jgi:hypothetical protein